MFDILDYHVKSEFKAVIWLQSIHTKGLQGILRILQVIKGFAVISRYLNGFLLVSRNFDGFQGTLK